MYQYDEFSIHIRANGDVEAKVEIRKKWSDFKTSQLSVSVTEQKYMMRDIEKLQQGELKSKDLQILGEALYSFLFTPEIGDLFERAVREVREYNKTIKKEETKQLKRLRVSIAVDQESEVMRWPLEFLRGPSGWLATDIDLTLSRRIVFEKGFVNLRSNIPPLKVLIMVSKPQGLEGVLSAKVIEEIASWAKPKKDTEAVSRLPREQLRSASRSEAGEEQTKVQVKLLGKVDDFERDIPGIKYLDLPATYTNLREIASSNWNPHVLHFIGHGKVDERAREGSLAMVGPDDGVDWCNSTQFVEVLVKLEPRLVVLQACESASPGTGPGFLSLAAHLVQHNIPAVVAMQFEIRNDYATLFSSEFYRTLAEGWEVDAAVQRGRWKIPTDQVRWNERHFGTPALFMLSPSGIIRPVSSVRRTGAESYKSEQTQIGGQATRGLSLVEQIKFLYEEASKAADRGDWEMADKLTKRAAELRESQQASALLQKESKKSGLGTSRKDQPHPTPS